MSKTTVKRQKKNPNQAKKTIRGFFFAKDLLFFFRKKKMFFQKAEVKSGPKNPYLLRQKWRYLQLKILPSPPPQKKKKNVFFWRGVWSSLS